jgi:type I restriction enzyme M protein
MSNGNSRLELGTLENWLWEAACVIRGPIDAPKFKDYILPLVFLKRLSDVFEDDLQQLGNTAKYVDADHSLVRFYIPQNARWPNVATQTTNLGEYLTDAVRSVARENPKLSGVIDVRDFNETAAGSRILDDNRLRALIQRLSQYRLGLKDVEPDILGRAYEYLLRKFAEGQGQSAGEFYTPREVAILMARILDPNPGDTIYDSTCGSGGLLVKSYLRFREKYSGDANVAPLHFYGQEINPTTFAMARMNAFIYDMEAEIAIGDTMNRPAFTNHGGSLRRFNKVTANPMWNQNFAMTTYEHDTYGRFSYGIPPASSADWGWVQHMFASLSDNGKMAMVIDTGAVSRGSGNQGSNRERDIRKVFVEKDWVEAVLLLPENLFYNTTAPGIVMVINKKKQHPGEILIINASTEFLKGRPKNYLSEDNVKRVADMYLEWREVDNLSKIIKLDEITRNDYNLSPSRYISNNDKEEVLPLDEAVVLLSESEEERAAADKELKVLLSNLGLGKTE